MRTITVLRPGARRVEIKGQPILDRLRNAGDLAPSVEIGDKVFMRSQYVSVPWIDTLNTWKIVDLVPREQLPPLAMLAARMERKGH